MLTHEKETLPHTQACCFTLTDVPLPGAHVLHDVESLFIFGRNMSFPTTQAYEQNKDINKTLAITGGKMYRYFIRGESV